MSISNCDFGVESTFPDISVSEIEHLLGDKVSNMVIYNFYQNIDGLNPGWNRTEYNGHEMHDLAEAANYAKDLRFMLPRLHAMILIAIKTVGRSDCHGMGVFSKNPKYTTQGRIMTNFIAFDKQTGKYHANKKGWYGTGIYPLSSHAAQRGVVNSLFFLRNNAWALHKMLDAAQAKQK